MAAPAGEHGGGRMAVEVVAGTDVGSVRTVNEDRFAVGDLDAGELLPGDDGRERDCGGRGLLLAVCDGMGGAAGGALASQLAIDALWTGMRDAPPTADVAVYARHLRRAMRTANQLILREGRRSGMRGMGTTASAAGTVGSTLVVAQVGDSRVYVERAGRLVQVTRDQSVVAALQRAGRMTEAEAKTSLQRSTILQALGIAEDVDVSLSIADLRRGDRVLLCSDGLHSVVEGDDVRRVLAGRAELGPALAGLLAAARAAGAPDNVTAIVARYRGDGVDAPGEGDELAFAELDPFLEGDGALSSTSQVARRLAARAGIGAGAPIPAIPATGQHPAISPSEVVPGAPEPPASEPPGPAATALAERTRLGRAVWIAAAFALGAVVALLLWGVP